MHDLSLTRQRAVGSADCARLAERRSPIRPHCRTDAGCWMLDVGCWMLDVGCWMLDVGCWMLDVGCWMLDVGCSAAGSETGTSGESPRSHAEGFHRLHSGNLPPAVDFFELHFELLHQRVAAAVEVSDCHELSGGRFRVRT